MSGGFLGMEPDTNLEKSSPTLDRIAGTMEVTASSSAYRQY